MSSARTSPQGHPDTPDAGRARTSPAAGGAGSPRPGLAAVLAGLGLAVLVLVLGVIAKTGPVTRFDLRLDRHIAARDRTSALTTLAKAASTIATPQTVGVLLMIGVPLILWLVRRRADALLVFCMFAGAFVLTEIGKLIIGEHRPPTSLWAMQADSGASYPSGHATTAAVLAVAIVFIAISARWRWRYPVIVLAIGYALAVAASRVYLADHYLLDVLGSIGCAVAAGLIVAGLARLPVLQPYLRRIDGRDRARPASQ